MQGEKNRCVDVLWSDFLQVQKMCEGRQHSCHVPRIQKRQAEFLDTTNSHHVSYCKFVFLHLLITVNETRTILKFIACKFLYSMPSLICKSLSKILMNANLRTELDLFIHT